MHTGTHTRRGWRLSGKMMRTLADLRRELAATQAALDERNRDLAALREGLKGFCGRVVRMRADGRPDAEIAAHLLGLHLSRLQVGLLLDRDESLLSAQGYRLRCDRLKKKDTL